MIEIYTDGSNKESGGDGGWAYVVVDEYADVIHEDSDYEPESTAPGMEVTALYKALEYIFTEYEYRMNITVYIDAKYCVNGARSWVDGWAKNGWQNSKGEEIAFVNLWKGIYKFKKKHNYTFKHVKSHSNNYWNEYCDDMARSMWKG